MKKTLFISFAFFIAFAFPSQSYAQVMFGGLDVFTIPCTCGFTFNYHWFAPLFLGPVPTTGPLAAAVTPTTFPFFVLHPGAWALGFYAPGVQSCWMYAAVACFPLPVLGTITPFTGTSP